MTASRSLTMAALVALAAPACATAEDRTIVGPVQDTLDAGHARGLSLANAASAELAGEDDYAVVIGKTGAILAAINEGEITQADFALQAALATDVADYAGAVLNDHAFLNVGLTDIVSQFGVGFIPSETQADVVNEFAIGLRDLRSTPPADTDLAYIDLQVRNHAAAQVLLAQLRKTVRNDEMGQFIDGMVDMEADHLILASALLATFF